MWKPWMTPNDVFATAKEDLMDAPPVYQVLYSILCFATDFVF